MQKDLFLSTPSCCLRASHESLVNFIFSEDLVLAEDRTTEADRELIMEGVRTWESTPRLLVIIIFSFFSARKKQAEKLKKISSVKTDSCDTDSVGEDGGMEIF